MALHETRADLSQVKKNRKKLREALKQLGRRRLRLEQLEERQLLAVGPQLIGIQPNSGTLLNDGDVRHAAPSDITFRFDENALIDPATLGGIRLVRSGFDGVMGNGNDVAIQPGFIGLGEVPHEVVMRFAEPLPDDVYQIEILGTGASALRSQNGAAFGDLTDDDVDDGSNFRLTFELDLAPQIISVVPQPIERVNGVLQQRRDEIVVYFNNDRLLIEHDAAGNPTPRSADHPAFYQLILTRDTARNTDDVVYTPESVAYDPVANTATLRFASDLSNLVDPATGTAIGAGTFRLRVGTDEQRPLAPQVIQVSDIGTPGSDFATALPIGLNSSGILVTGGASSITAGQTLTVTNAAGTSRVFQFTTGAPPSIPGAIAINYSGATTAAVLASRIATAINGSPLGSIATVFGTHVTFGPSVTATLSANATGVSVERLNSIELSHALEPVEYPNEWPGALDEPGHRWINQENHYLNIVGTAGIPVIAYNFQDVYGVDPNGNPLHNLITENQKQRAREIFTIYSKLLGVQFVESDAAGFTIVTGDMRALDPNIPTGPGGTLGQSLSAIGLPGTGIAIMDNAELWYDGFGQVPPGSPAGMESWFEVAMHEIGHLLGLGHSYDLPNLTIQGAEAILNFDNRIEPQYPGDHDIVHGQYLYRPEGIDVDLYQFRLEATGVLSVETFAERLPNSSLLDTRLALYQVLTDANGAPVLDINGNPVRRLIAQNDDYYSKDSFLELTLGPGTYYLGVSASGNDSYDPAIPNSGIGGTSDGEYRLRMTFGPDASRSIVDKPADLEVTGAGSVIADGRQLTITDQTGASRTFEFDKNNTLSNPDHIRIAITNQTSAVQIATALTTAINNSGLSLSATRVGTQIRLHDDAKVTLGAGLSGIRTDLPGVAFDGDHDGRPGGVYNFWFRTAPIAGTNLPGQPKTIIVDKSAPAGGDGSLARPLNNIGSTNPLSNSAFFGASKANPGDIIRVVGNGGLDGNGTTLTDNFAYEVGFDALGRELPDGSTLAIPQGVTLMVDAGAIFKLRRARIGVGSSNLQIDRSGGALQVLGTPTESAYFTSWHDATIGRNTDPFNTAPKGGDWGGLVFRTDVDKSQGRFTWDREGIFLDYVNHADIRWGGGNIVVDSVPQVINPIHMIEARPTISYNSITRSSDAAVSADPNSFAETNFHSPQYQLNGVYTSDYDRVGPAIYGNRLLNNSTNGLFIRVVTPAGDQLRPMTVSGRWDDTDIVHVLTENLRIEGTPGGPVLDVTVPPVLRVTLTPLPGGTLTPDGTYNYIVVYVDRDGNESPSSAVTYSATLSGDERSIRLNDLPPAPEPFVSRRIYRSDATGGGTYQLVAEIDRSSTQFLDNGTTHGGPLQPATGTLRARLDARLSIDPGLIVKLEGARIEVGVGATFIAEALDGREVIFTSRLDDRYGASGTTDTNNDNSLGAQESNPQPGNWGGIYVGPAAMASIDHALFTYGGGVNKVEGSFAGFNVIEVHHGGARITNSVFERNAEGTGGQAADTRFGRGHNDEGVIFVRNAEPLILVGNSIRDNARATQPANPDARIAAININANGLYHNLQTDMGRATGFADRIEGYRDNRGPLIRENRISNTELNGMKVRPETLTTQAIWDDTDIVHILLGTIYVPDFHTFGGLRMQSSLTESLIVKLFGPTAGFTATGRPLDINDRIGGIVQVIGQPGSPVVFTSLRDDSIGAGFQTFGSPITDTNNDGSATVPLPGDWRSIRIDQFAHDRNVEVILEEEPRDVDAPGPNAIPDRAQVLGRLASNEKAGDENQRLGFEIVGLLNAPNDLDVYSFSATAGTEVWFDMDRSTHALDAVIELLDQNGQVIARSTNSQTEQLGTSTIYRQSPTVQANILQKSPFQPKDFWGTNPRDPGMRVVLPGSAGVETEYFVRIRSNNPQVDTNLLGGLTSGVYHVQVRLRETDEVAGSTVRFADIRYATNAIEVIGQPLHSPLLGEAAEAATGADNNDTITTALNLGNLLNTDRAALTVAGRLSSANDVDFYAFDVEYDSVQVNELYSFLSAVFDIDYADGMARPNTRLAVYDSNFRLILFGDDSNIADDQPRPLHGADMTDLTRGSAGTHDAYIGTQTLPLGRYYVAVFNTSLLPAAMDQYHVANPANPLIRLEPVTSVVRIAEDHIDSSGGSTLAPPQTPALLRAENAVPFHLGDVTLFVSSGRSTTTGHLTTFHQVNPFTGFVTNRLNQIDAAIGDIAMRFDGQLFTYSHIYFDGREINDNSVGNYLRIETGVDTITPLGYEVVGDDGMQTWEIDTEGNEARADFFGVQNGSGMWVNAITFLGDDQLDGFFIGNRGEQMLGGEALGVARTKNIIYQFDINTGAAYSDPQRLGCTTNICRYAGAGTTIIERGEVITLFSSITVPDPTEYQPSPLDVTTPVLTDGVEFTIEHSPIFGRTSTTFEFDTGPEVRLTIDPEVGRVVRDGYYFSLDDYGASRFGVHYQFDTGATITIPDYDQDGIAGEHLLDGTTVRLMDTSGATVVFEFEDVGVAAPDGQQTAGSVLISYTANTTVDELQTLLTNAINSVGASSISATAVDTIGGERLVALEGDLATANTVVVSPGASVAVGTSQIRTFGTDQRGRSSFAMPTGDITDGQAFTITTLDGPIVFEFDNDGTVTDGNLALTFTTAATPAEIAARNHALAEQVVTHLNDNDSRLSPRNLGTAAASDPYNGYVQLNRGILVESDHGQAPIYKMFTGGQFADAQFFTVQTEGRAVTFEFDIGNGVTAGRIPIPVTGVDSAEDVAAKVARAVRENTNATAINYGDEVVFNGLGIIVTNVDGSGNFTSRMRPVAIFNNVERGPNGMIPVEEYWTRDEVGNSIVTNVGAALPVNSVSDAGVTPILLNVPNHGLTTGQAVMIEGVVAPSGTGNNPRANGVWDVQVVNNDEFILVDSRGASFDSSGGVFYMNRPSFEGDRMNFQAVNRTDLRGALDVFAPVAGPEGGVNPGNIRVGFLAGESQEELAQRVSDIIRRELFPQVAPSTSPATPGTIELTDATARGDLPLTFTGFGNGGTVTGLANVNGVMYAVDDTGMLYRLNVLGSELVSELVANVGGESIEFSGLTAGPPHVEGGRYANVLFGISRTGVVYAFDTNGTLLPVFMDGQTRISTGVTEANGLAFSNLDLNLWHVTTNRELDAGHGLNIPFDLSRFPDQSVAGVDGNPDGGGASFWFGFENPAANGYSAAPDPGISGSYNFPGGAHGQLESSPFSLEGYSAADVPMLYFNYFLATEGTDYVDNNNRMRDAFRVYITDSSGDWQLLGTNNSFRGPGTADDEFELRDGVVELFDNSNSWRQARIDLSEFAGRSDLRLRFEFTTAGESFDGHPLTTGQQLRTVPGSAIRDGDTFVVDNSDTFEFDLGYTLVAPTGARIQTGQTISINDGVGGSATFTFHTAPGAGRIVISATMTAEEVAMAIEQAISGSGLAVAPIRDGNRVNLQGSPAITVALSAGSPVLIDGAPGGQAGAAQIIPIRPDMTAQQVRDAVRTALANQYAGGVLDAFKVYGDNVIRVIGHVINPAQRGPLGVNNPDPAIASGEIPRDLWGSFLSNGAPEVGGPYPDGYELPQRNLDNNHEGVYIDDLIIGFAERGEMVTVGGTNTGFFTDPITADPTKVESTAILVGDYQLEIRPSADWLNYGGAAAPPRQRSIDSNDRLTHSVALVAPDSINVFDGQTFTISDGLNTVVFEYEDVLLNNGVRPGNIPVPFNPQAPKAPNGILAQADHQVAASIRNAINSPAVQAVLKITAGLSDGTATGTTSTSNLVYLYGNATGDRTSGIPGVHPAFDFGNIELVTFGYQGSTEHVWEGDSNRVRDQGQILIHSNIISNSSGFGIVSDAGSRNRSDLIPLGGTLPHQGSPATLRETNPRGWVPGVVIANNLIYDSGAGGIRFSGDDNLAGQPRAAIPFGRIVNNTIYGRATTDIGIQVDQFASPTILNNIVANFGTGIAVDSTSTSTIIGGSVYQNNVTHTVGKGVGDFAIVLGPDDPLFVNAEMRNFYPAAGSLIIDSSIDGLEDRPDLVTVKNPLGIAHSPIKAPQTDLNGLLRVDDETVPTPSGQGSNVFIDRGAIDRSDFVGPTAVILTPRDNDSDGNDLDSIDTVIRLPGTTVLSSFTIQVVDGVEPADPAQGVGVDDLTVVSEAVVLRRNGVTLQDGVDYTFNYNETTNTIRLTPLAGIWPKDSIYTIELANSPTDGILDLAGNGLKPNRASGETAFTIVLGSVPLDFGDAPNESVGPGFHYPTQLVNEGAHHLVIGDNPLRLGSLIDVEFDGQPSLNALGDDNDVEDDEDGVQFAMPFNAFIETPIIVTASGVGRLDAWIDFNGDGRWDETEKIFDSVLLEEGENTLFVQTPASAAIGFTYARFRLSANGGLGPIGLAESGEVEDYRIEILGGTPPVANDDPSGATVWTTDEDTVLNVTDSVLDNDVDTEPLTVFNAGEVITTALGAQVIMNADGTFTYDPRPAAGAQRLLDGEVATDTFTYRAFDGLLASDPATVTIQVTGRNDVPVAVENIFDAVEDGPVLTTGFGGFDADEGHTETLTYDIVPGSHPAEGTVVNNGDGTFSFDPLAGVAFQDLAKDEIREVSFQYTATDVEGAQSDPGLIRIRVTGVNDAPIANNQEVTVFEDSLPQTFLFAGFDIDSDITDSTQLTYELFGASPGLLVNNGDGTFTVDPGTRFQELGLDDSLQLTYLYRATDNHGAQSAFGTLTITVRGVNDPPIANNDPPAPNVYVTNEDTPLEITTPSGGLLANDTDVDATDVLVIRNAPTTVISQHGASVHLNADGTFTYDPRTAPAIQSLNFGQMLADSFTYVVSDGHGGEATGTVAVTVTGLNDLPVANPLVLSAEEDGGAVTGILPGDDIDQEDNPNTLFYALLPGTGPSEGTVTLNGRQITYHPGDGFSYLRPGEIGEVTFQYRVVDSRGAISLPGTVTIQVTGNNDPPVAVDDLNAVNEFNSSAIITVLVNDTDPDGSPLDPTRIEIVTPPMHGTAVPNPNGTITYTSTTGYLGTDTFTYRIWDDEGPASLPSLPAAVNVVTTIFPVAGSTNVTAFIDTPKDINVVAISSDADGSVDPSSVVIVGGPAHGTATVSASGVITYTPAIGFTGADAIEYTISDNVGATSAPGVINITVTNNPTPHRNARNRFDVNDDGRVNSYDVLLVIAYLNTFGQGAPTGAVPPYVDVAPRDNFVNTQDVRAIIEFLVTGGSGEGESLEGEAPVVVAAVDYADLNRGSSSAVQGLDVSRESRDAVEQADGDVVTLSVDLDDELEIDLVEVLDNSDDLEDLLATDVVARRGEGEDLVDKALIALLYDSEYSVRGRKA